MYRVDFFVDSTAVYTDTSAPYSSSYNTRNLSDGPHVITTRATDAAGNVTLSAPVNVIFDNDLTAPSTSTSITVSN